MPRLSVGPAQLADCGAIAAIAAACSLENLNSADAPHLGFLVGARDEQGYQDAIAAGHTLLVCRSRGVVIGFLHAYSLARSTDSEMRTVAETITSGTAYLIKQVAVDPERRRGGAASLLYDRFIESVDPLPVLAGVVADPPNLPSIRHHRAHGFAVGGQYIGSDGYPRLLFMILGASKDNTVELRNLIEQYSVAVNLYLHEDRTNWVKMNNFFYVTAGLLAVVGIILPEFMSGVVAAPASAKFALGSLLSLGLVSSALFFIALRSGIFYLNARKEAARKLENRIIALGGSTILGPRAMPSAPRILRRSPTTKVMVLLPLIVGLVWLSAGVLISSTLLHPIFRAP
jgi:L-amino acid N-acyltransferase YncA